MSGQGVKIEKIYTSRIEKIEGKLTYVFICMVAPNGINRMCEIRYDMMSTSWRLNKM